LTRRILRRDARRVRVLAVLSVFFWVLTAAGVAAMIWFYFTYLAPRLGAYAAGRARFERDWDAWLMVAEWAATFVLACLAAFVAAAVCTVLLVLVTRRATLRQINASLAAISEQLNQLRLPAPGGPQGPGGTA
jgi:hypothetical protein